MLPSFRNSQSVKFKNRQKKLVDIDDEQHYEEPLDQIMQNMLELLGTKEQKQRKFDPRQIQLIKRFENLNDFDRPPDLGEPEVENETDQPRSQRNNSHLVNNQEPGESVHA